MTPHVVAKPHQSHRLSHVTTANNKIEGKVASADRYVFHIQQYSVSDSSNAASYDDGTKTVLEPVRHHCGDKGKDSGDNEDWDTHHLSVD